MTGSARGGRGKNGSTVNGAEGAEGGEGAENEDEEDDDLDLEDAVLQGEKVTEASKKQEREHERYVLPPLPP